MNRRATQLFAAIALSTQLVIPAWAVNLAECNDYRSSVQSLAEPWEKNTRTYLNGAVRIALVDTGGEPACCSYHLVVLTTKPEDSSGPAEQVCRVVSQENELGFMSIDLARIRASYNPSHGLNLLVPFQTYVDGVRSRPGTFRVSLDPRTGVITAR